LLTQWDAQGSEQTSEQNPGLTQLHRGGMDPRVTQMVGHHPAFALYNVVKLRARVGGPGDLTEQGQLVLVQVEVAGYGLP
jgi:hypothetical protein